MLQEFLAGEVGFLYSLSSELGHNFCFGGDGRVVGTRYPERIFAVHSGATDKNVLNGVVEHVTHVKDSGDVWGRNHDTVGFATVGFAMEKIVVHPVGIPFVLDFRGIVFWSQLVHIGNNLIARILLAYKKDCRPQIY